MAGMREAYLEYVRRRNAVEKTPFGKIWLDQESRYVHPFKVFGNIWYVGDSWVCVHLIDTGDGLLLLDGGNCGATGMLVQAIWEAGFDPADVKWMILSHGHLDHFGSATFFRKMFGTKLYLGEPDAVMFRERPELSAIYDSGDIKDSLFEPDVCIRDGDELDFGSLKISFRLVPGHTEGCIAAFFDAEENDKVLRVGYYGGFGFNTLSKDSLIEMGDPAYQTRNVYLASLAKVRNERVDIFLGNHTNNNRTMEKRAKLLGEDGENPFIDSEEWGRYLDQKRDELLAFMADPRNN